MKIFKVLLNILKVFATIIIVLMALVICLQRFSNNTISFFDYKVFSVVTGSMAPQYNIGDVLLCKSVDVNTLKVGDDITYLGNVGSYDNKVVTHRIIRIENEGEELQFYTKGIASLVEDPVVSSSQIYGKVYKRLTILSFFYKLISSGSGFYIFIVVPIVFIIGSEIVSSMVERYSKKISK